MTGPVRGAIGVPADELTSCCARLYESDVVRLLLGDSLHPSGLRLTDRLAGLMRLSPESRVLDVACGRGESALHLARTVRCRVVGVDAGANTVVEANLRARDAGLADRVTFEVGRATCLDAPDASFDAVICECAFCTFPDKLQAAREFARVLRPGGVIGISDVTTSGALPAELQGLLAWVACIADAQPLQGYASQLRTAGLHIDVIEEHNDALHELVDAVRQRLVGASLLAATGRIGIQTVDVETGRRLAAATVDAVNQGTLGYGIVVASQTAAAPRV